MRAVVQRVSRASVSVEGVVVGRIARGLCALVGVGVDDQPLDAALLAEKVAGLRVFEDAEGKMNLALGELGEGAALLAVSQFTLFGDVRRGRRPSFTQAMEPERARDLFETFVRECRARGLSVETGRFRAHMEVELLNEGPVTLLIDTKKLF
jgi:D-tyrosyl-tRNA(Tyr) deacylase